MKWAILNRSKTTWRCRMVFYADMVGFFGAAHLTPRRYRFVCSNWKIKKSWRLFPEVPSQHSVRQHQKLLWNRYYMSISKTSRSFFWSKFLFQKLQPFVCINPFLMVLDHILYWHGMVSIRGAISKMACGFDGVGPYLQGVEVRFGFGALRMENGVCINSSLIHDSKKS